jgi:hypothetical protein
VVERHVAAINEMLAMTPYEDERHGELTLTTVTKMTMVLPSREAGDLAAEAKGEAYMAALEDIPSWAVQEAMRRWYRSECGDKHDYRWQPAPATLREVSMIEVYRAMAVRRRLTDLINAEPMIEYTPEQEAKMRKKVARYLKARSA